MTTKTTLYTKQGLKFRQWSAWTEGAEVVVEHGQVGGKLTQKRYTAEPKNILRSNATTAEEQSLVEMEAKVVFQLKRGYYRTIEEAENHVDFTPMKCLDYKDHSKKVKYPCYMSAKLDGFRMMVDSAGQAWSKQGEPLEFPAHWQGLKELLSKVGGGDGEVYCQGMSLQSIRSAYLTLKEETKSLQFWVYDVPVPNEDFKQRQERLFELASLVKEKGLDFIRVIPGVTVYNEEQADTLYNEHLKLGYEGSVYRNTDGMYDFGKRSSGMLKRKPRHSNEALVLSYALDKNDEPVYNVKAVNGEQVGVEFKLKMKIPDGVVVEGRNYRNKENADRLVGKHIEYEWENLSDENIPNKGVGIRIKEVLNGEGRY